jgi:hypothetical protein
MKYDSGMFCEICGCVTIFQAEATTPRRCARCDEHEPPYVTPLRDRPTRPSLGARRAELSHVDWLE